MESQKASSCPRWEKLEFTICSRVGHDWATPLSLFTFMHWRRKWQPPPVFLPGQSYGTGEPSGLLSMGSHRVGYDWSDLAAAAGDGKRAKRVRLQMSAKERGSKNERQCSLKGQEKVNSETERVGLGEWGQLIKRGWDGWMASLTRWTWV